MNPGGNSYKNGSSAVVVVKSTIQVPCRSVGLLNIYEEDIKGRMEEVKRAVELLRGPDPQLHGNVERCHQPMTKSVPDLSNNATELGST